MLCTCTKNVMFLTCLAAGRCSSHPSLRSCRRLLRHICGPVIQWVSQHDMVTSRDVWFGLIWGILDSLMCSNGPSFRASHCANTASPVCYSCEGELNGYCCVLPLELQWHWYAHVILTFKLVNKSYFRCGCLLFTFTLSSLQVQFLVRRERIRLRSKDFYVQVSDSTR